MLAEAADADELAPEEYSGELVVELVELGGVLASFGDGLLVAVATALSRV